MCAFRPGFFAEQADYGESLDAIDRAIVVLMKKTADKPALLQLTESAQLPAKAQAMITAFMGMMQDHTQHSPTKRYCGRNLFRK